MKCPSAKRRPAFGEARPKAKTSHVLPAEVLRRQGHSIGTIFLPDARRLLSIKKSIE